MSTAWNHSTIKIISIKLFVRIVLLSAKDNVKLKKQLSDGFKTSFYGNKYKFSFNVDKDYTINNMNNIRWKFDSSFQRVKRLFACSYNDGNGGVKLDTYQK